MKLNKTLWGVIAAVLFFTGGYLIAETGDYATLGYDSTNSYSIWRVNSTGEFVPGADDTFDIGSSSYEIKDLYVDGTAYIDSAEITALSGDVAMASGSSFTLLSMSSTSIAAYTFAVGEMVFNSTRYAVCIGTSATGTGSAVFQSSNPITNDGISCKE